MFKVAGKRQLDLNFEVVLPTQKKCILFLGLHYMANQFMKYITFTAFFFTTILSLAQVSWKVDPTHGHFGFSVKYMMLGDYQGCFKNYDGKIRSKSESDFTDAVFNIVIDINSVGAQVEGHEEMLKEENFFDVAQHPFAYFRSTRMKKGAKPGAYDLEGNLTIRGITKKVNLTAVSANKPVINPYFNAVNYAFKISGKIRRSDFGIGNYDLMEGGLVLSDEVKLDCFLVLMRAERDIPVADTKMKVEEKEAIKLVGQYDYEKGQVYSISHINGQLFAKTTKGTKKEIYPIGKNKFIYEFYDVELEFIEDANGNVSKVIIPKGSGRVEAVKFSDSPEVIKSEKNDSIEIDNKQEAERAFSNRDYKRTIEFCLKSLEKDPENLFAKIKLAHAYLFSGEEAKAISVYKENMDKKAWGVVPFSRLIQQDFIFLKSRRYSSASLDKAFQALGMIPTDAYKSIK